MSKKLARFVLKLFGWNVEIKIPPEVRKMVVMMAPHTSNWDFLLGWLGYKAIGVNSKYLIKREAFFFPLGKILLRMGAIPVDRKSSTNIVIQVGDLFKNEEVFYITITPEGSRSLRTNWKRGFYYMAQHAQVPIAFGYLDYKKKIGGIGGMIYPTGDFDKDFKEIEAFYSKINAKYPEKFSLSPQYRNKKN